jgi:hypothetical protein
VIVLSVAHSSAARGAVYNGHDEHTESSAWTSIVANYLRHAVPVRTIINGALPQKVETTNSLNDVLLAVEIHFNSDESRRQSGSETLYAPRSILGRLAAEIVQRELAGVFPPSRGAKEGWYRMDKPGHIDYPGDKEGDEAPDYFLARTKCTALIVEPEFIYNWETIDAKRRAGCVALAKGLLAAYNFIEARRNKT